MLQRGLNDHPLLYWQEALWLLIALLTPLFVNLWVEQQFEASKIWLFRTLIFGLAAFWLAGFLRGSEPRRLQAHIPYLCAALIFMIALATLFSANPSIAFYGTLDRANGALTQFGYILLFGCVATQINPEQGRRLLSLILLTGVPICLLGLAQAAGWQPLSVTTDARSLITTTLGRANFTGAYLALLLPLSAAAVQSTADRWKRAGYALLFALEIIVILLTQARAAWIAAAVGMGAYLWLQFAPEWPRREQRLTLLTGVAALAGGLLLMLQHGLAGGGSIAARWTIWQASLRLLPPRLWLGYGADTLELYFPSVYPPQLVYYQGRAVVVDRAHNWLLDWSLNWGIVATLLFAALSALILWKAWQQLTARAGPTSFETGSLPLEKPWLAAAAAGICAQLAGNLFLFDVAATAVTFWLFLAIVTAAAARRPEAMIVPSLPRHMDKLVVVVSILLVGAAVWFGSVRPLLADGHSWRGTGELSRGNAAGALVEYEAAARHQPFRAEYLVAVALTAAQAGDFGQAEATIAAAIALRPTDPALVAQLAAIYAHEASETHSSQSLYHAYEAYEQAIALAPTIAVTYQQYADLALRSGDWQIALREAERAVALDATDGVSFGIIGWSQIAAGDLPAARYAFEQAVTWQPDSADFYLGLATVHFQQGSFTAARQSVGRSLLLDPDYAPALTLQRRLPES